MTLNSQLGNQIAAKARAILKRQVLMADTTGQVIGGLDDQEPVFSAEALTCIQTGHQIIAEFEGNQVQWSPFVYENQTLGTFGLSLATGPITPEALALIQGLAEVITHQYLLVDRVQSRDELRQTLLHEILTAPKFDADDLARRSDILQLNLEAPASLLVIQQPDQDKISLNQMLSVLLSDEGLAPTDQSIILGQNEVAIIKTLSHPHPTSQNTARWLSNESSRLQTLLQKEHQLPITFGIGQYYPNLDGLRKSYTEARLALEVGSRVWGPGRVYHIRQVGMFITLTGADQKQKADLASQIFSPLLRDEQLYKSVQTFLTADLNLTEAAERLHIHRNTLIYRLDKTRKLIGLDPRQFDDALQIKLGLMFYQPAEV